jgi:hypothetical protein
MGATPARNLQVLHQKNWQINLPQGGHGPPVFLCRLSDGGYYFELSGQYRTTPS